MKKKIFISMALLLPVCLSSCCEAVFKMATYLKNNTNSLIELKIYDKGKIESLKINGSSTLEAPFVITPGDSILVFYESTLINTHYSESIKSNKILPTILRFADAGNLYNSNSYSVNKRELKCNGSITEATYVFK